ncbi:hypothetical protein TRVL_05757 [Trypanosoma vivax]|nr:hypothetical protein TRVL_05757 [Trypanosoma vivax]
MFCLRRYISCGALCTVTLLWVVLSPFFFLVTLGLLAFYIRAQYFFPTHWRQETKSGHWPLAGESQEGGNPNVRGLHTQWSFPPFPLTPCRPPDPPHSSLEAGQELSGIRRLCTSELKQGPEFVTL